MWNLEPIIALLFAGITTFFHDGQSNQLATKVGPGSSNKVLKPIESATDSVIMKNSRRFKPWPQPQLRMLK
jgi:hypothetical protein